MLIPYSTAFVQYSAAFPQRSTAFTAHHSVRTTQFVQHSAAFIHPCTALVQCSVHAAQYSVRATQHSRDNTSPSVPAGHNMSPSNLCFNTRRFGRGIVGMPTTLCCYSSLPEILIAGGNTLTLRLLMPWTIRFTGVPNPTMLLLAPPCEMSSRLRTSPAQMDTSSGMPYSRLAPIPRRTCRSHASFAPLAPC